MTAVFGVFCDGCRRLITTDDPKATAETIRRDLTTRAGWVHHKLLMRDVCDECQKRGKTKAEKTQS